MRAALTIGDQRLFSAFMAPLHMRSGHTNLRQWRAGIVRTAGDHVGEFAFCLGIGRITKPAMRFVRVFGQVVQFARAGSEVIKRMLGRSAMELTRP